ncbi:response regulator [Streptacidiphilus rugosus]|uniref:response regulator n=1 Tax=Streptacidiphilus rugosus TaxID=405783 RepID=UPI0012FB8BC1|nr:response regulator [Streptacidiphilus rugosus]
MFDQEDRMLHSRISTVQGHNTILLVTIGSGLALIIALTTLMSHRIAQNISHVADAARALAAGKLERRARVTSRDEIASLADTFNTMADNLQESYSTVEEKVRLRTEQLHQRTRSLQLLQGVAAAGNKASTWDEVLADGLPLICAYMGWPAACAYTAVPAPEPALATTADAFTSAAVWVMADQWPESVRERLRAALDRGPSALTVRTQTSGRPQGPERLGPESGLTPTLSEQTGIAGAVGFPVLLHQGTGGVVEFFTTTLQPLDESAISLIAGLVSQLGRVREREIAAQALESTAREANAANRAKGTFLATMSHEIRTPMNAVMGMSELLMGTSLSDEQRNYAEIVQSSADSLLTIINDILDFSKFEAGKFEIEEVSTDLRQCIESAFDLITPRADEKHELDLAFAIDPELPDEIMCDGLRLRQVIVNLLSNAMKFTEAGEVVLTAARVESSDAGTPLQSRAPSEQGVFTVQFSVRDTGIGIPSELIDRLFQPFDQLDSSTTRRFGGTGLGLAISQRLVELMGGTIWAESEVGRGSTFHFTIVTRETPAQLRQSRAASRTELQGMRMLVVDDNATNRMLLARQANAWGMHVRATSSPQEALRWIRDGDPFDVAVFDLWMPEQDGIELAREISRHRANLPMILLTSVGKPDASPEDLALFSACHTKPIRAALLYASLLAALLPERSALTERRAVADEPPGEELKPLRILLAEDNNVNQQLALRMLSKIGYTADAVGDGAQALEALRAKPYDVVLMDVHMPVMNGLTASRAIHQEWPSHQRPRIIALTASAMRGDREACIAAGMDDYLTKPLSLKTLAHALAQYTPVTPISADTTVTTGSEAASPPQPEQQPEAVMADKPILNSATLGPLISSLDVEFTAQLMDAFLEDSPHLVEEIRQGVHSGDAELVHRAAHTLKSNCKTFGLDQLTPLCQRLENLTADGGLDGVTDVARDIAASYALAREAVSRARQELSQD